MGIMFNRDMLDLVLAGKKTQTRRQVKEGQWLDWDYDCHGEDGFPIAVMEKSDRPKWRLWETYAVQPGRGKKGEGRVEIVSIRLERFFDISQADAEAEGFDSPEGFFAKIKSIYGDDFNLEQPCWVLEFKLVTV